MSRPPIALTCGEPGGIGLEIAAKAWDAVGREIPFFLIGDAAHLAKGLGAERIERIDRPGQARAAKALPVMQHDFPAAARPGHADPANARGVI